MNCYLCLVEAGFSHQPVYALCQKCLAGICRDHLVEMGTVSLSGYPVQPHFLCRRCYHLTHASAGSSYLQDDHRKKQKETTFSWRSWWQQLWLNRKNVQTPLPTPEEAVQTVEDYLKHLH